MDNNRPIRVLSTKNLPPDFIKEARANGVDIDQIEAIEVVLKDPNEEALNACTKAENLVFTSMSAVKAIFPEKSLSPLMGKKIYCVGNRIADFFSNNTVIKADNAEDLSRLILQDKPKTVLYFHGNRSLQTIPNALGSSATEMKGYEVYDTILKNPKLELSQYQYIWFFSPSGVESLMINNGIPKEVSCIAIGKTTASYLAGYNCIISENPDLESMLKCTLNKHYSNEAV